MVLTTQLRVLIEGDASSLIGQLTKAQRASSGVFTEISRSAKQEFAAATKAADSAFKEVARLTAMANRADKGGASGYANALRSQAAAKAAEAKQFGSIAEAAEKKIQAEAAKTVVAHAAEATAVSKLGATYAQQGGGLSRFFGAITSGSGGSKKALGELKTAFSSLVSGGGIGGLTNLASTGLKGLATGLGTAGKAGEEAATGLAATGTAAEGATGGLAGMGAAGLGVTAGLLAGAAAVGVLGKAIDSGTKHFLEYSAQTRQVQRLTGATAEDASKLAGVFRHFGIDVDQGSRALGILAKNAETAGGKKLTDLGITIAHIGNTTKVDLLGTLNNVGEAFKKAGAGAEGTNIALQAMGRGGAVMIPVLQAVTGQLKGINEQTARQGLVFSQEEVNSAKEMTLATREVHHSLEGLEVTIAKPLVPFFTQQIEGASTFLQFLTQATDKVEGFLNIGSSGGGVTDLLKGTAAILPGIGQLAGALEGLSGGEKASAKDAQALEEKLQAAADASDTMAAQFEAGTGAIIKTGQANIAFKDSLNGVASAIAKNGKTLDTNTDAGRRNVEAALQVAAAAEADGEAIARSTGNVDKGNKALDRHKAVLLELLTQQLGSGKAAEDFALKFGLLTPAGIKAAHGLKLTNDEMKTLKGVTGETKTVLQQFNDEMDRTTGVNLSAMDADIRFRDSLDTLKKSLQENGAALAANGESFDLNTDAGRKNQTALDGSISSVLAAAKATGEHETALHGEAAGLAAANAVLSTHRSQLVEAAMSTGLTREAATKLVDALLKIKSPPPIVVTAETAEAERKINALVALANAVGNFSVPVGQTRKFATRATGGLTHKGEDYEVGERGPELWVASAKGKKPPTTLEHLTKQAKTGADETLVRLGIPGGIEPRATRKGTPALLLGTQGPQTFTPPADGVVVNATDTKRLQRTEDPGIIERILKRAGADRKTLEALAAGPGRAVGGPTTKDRQYQTGEKGPELFVPAQKTSAIALTGHADKESRGALVRLALPGGIESTASHIGSPALLLGQHGPQMFTPPTDGVIVKASDTQRLRRTDDADIIARILQRAGADKGTVEALASAPAPARAQGGSVRQGSEPSDPTFAFSPKTSATPTVASPGVKRGADGSYNITIGDTHLKVEAGTSGSAKGINKSDVDKIVERHQANLVQELTAALRSG